LNLEGLKEMGDEKRNRDKAVQKKKKKKNNSERKRRE